MKILLAIFAISILLQSCGKDTSGSSGDDSNSTAANIPTAQNTTANSSRDGSHIADTVSSSGTETNSSMESTTSNWSLDELASSKQACVTDALIATTYTYAFIFLYCTCAIEAASKRWAYDDFAANEFTYTEGLKTDGTISKCKKAATN